MAKRAKESKVVDESSQVADAPAQVREPVELSHAAKVRALVAFHESNPKVLNHIDVHSLLEMADRGEKHHFSDGQKERVSLLYKKHVLG